MLQQQQSEPRPRRRVIDLARVLAVLAALLVPALSASAQERTLTVSLAGLTVDSPAQARAVVTVLDGEGLPVVDLSQGDFQAQLNGLPAPVVALDRGVDSSLPIDVVLALDVSGSMGGGVLEEAKTAAGRFMDGLEPQDRLAVLTFNDAVDLVLMFTEDRDAANAAMEGLSADGATALFQATADSVHLAAAAGSSYRAVVLLSDGLDHGSTVSRDEALAAVETLGVPVFAIGLGEDIDRDYLAEVAELSGGQFAETPSPSGLAQLYQEVAELLRGQYILTLDTSGFNLPKSEPAALLVSVASGGGTGSAARVVCAQQLCVSLGGLEEPLEAATVMAADIISADPIASVAFVVDGETMLELSEPPYEFTFDPDSFAAGAHALAVQVETVAGHTEVKEITVRTNTGGGGSSSLIFIGGGVVVAVVVVGLALLFLQRKPRAKERELDPNKLVPPPKTTALRLGQEGSVREDEPPSLPPEPSSGRLCITGGALAGQTFPVGEAPVSIGSGAGCGLRLVDETLPAESARVWVRNGQLMLHEVRRLSGTDSDAGRWQILEPGDDFPIGQYTLRFELGAEDEAPRDVPNVLRDSAEPAHEPKEQPGPTGDAPEPDDSPAVDGDEPSGGVSQFPTALRPQPDD